MGAVGRSHRLLGEVVNSEQCEVNPNDLLSHEEKADVKVKEEIVLRRSGHGLNNLQHALDSLNYRWINVSDTSRRFDLLF